MVQNASKGLNGKTWVFVVLGCLGLAATWHTTFIVPTILRSANHDAQEMLDRHNTDLDRREGAILDRIDRMETSLEVRLQRIEEKIR